jgi:hypothetical protein
LRRAKSAATIRFSDISFENKEQLLVLIETPRVPR